MKFRLFSFLKRSLATRLSITRFKGLGEISPDEFIHFIGKDMRLDPVTLRRDDGIQNLLRFYLGENTPERQDFILNHLRIEEDKEEEFYPME